MLQSDNGGEFRNHILPPIVKKWCRTGDTVLLELISFMEGRATLSHRVVWNKAIKSSRNS